MKQIGHCFDYELFTLFFLTCSYTVKSISICNKIEIQASEKELKSTLLHLFQHKSADKGRADLLFEAYLNGLEIVNILAWQNHTRRVHK